MYDRMYICHSSLPPIDFLYGWASVNHLLRIYFKPFGNPIDTFRYLVSLTTLSLFIRLSLKCCWVSFLKIGREWLIFISTLVHTTFNSIYIHIQNISQIQLYFIKVLFLLLYHLWYHSLIQILPIGSQLMF